jgi:hypothetical protein
MTSGALIGQKWVKCESKGLDIPIFDILFRLGYLLVKLQNCILYFFSLGYLLETEEVVPIHDFRGLDIGHLDVKLYPCDQEGQIITDYIEDPKALIGKDLNILAKIDGAKGLPGNISESYATYKIMHSESHETEIKKGINPNYGDINVGQLYHLTSKDLSTTLY